MKKTKKQSPKYYMPGFIRAHVIDQKERKYIISTGFVTMQEGDACINDMILRTTADKCPIIAGWLSQDIAPVF